jgi:hypothetical protein
MCDSFLCDETLAPKKVRQMFMRSMQREWGLRLVSRLMLTRTFSTFMLLFEPRAGSVVLLSYPLEYPLLTL